MAHDGSADSIDPMPERRAVSNVGSPSFFSQIWARTPLPMKTRNDVRMCRR